MRKTGKKVANHFKCCLIVNLIFCTFFFTDGGSPRLTMLNGKYYERKNEEIDKVLVARRCEGKEERNA